MKKASLVLLAVLLAAPEVFALMTGDTASKWDASQTISGLRIPWDLPRKDDRKMLTCLVFFSTYSELSGRAFDELTALQKRFRKPGLRVIAVSMQPESAIRDFVKARGELNFPVQSDPRGTVTNLYMRGRRIFPMVYAIDEQAKIVWDGEVADLTEMLERYYGGTFDAARQRRVAARLDELQRAMQQMDERAAARATDAVLSLDSGNIPALRMRSFMLESSGRSAAAWKLLERAAERNAASRQVQMLRFDFAARRMPGELPRVAREMLKNVQFSESDAAVFAWRLLTDQSFDPELVLAASRVLAPFRDKSSAEVLASRALLAYRLGRVADAVALQAQATRQASGIRAERSGKLEKYYRALAAIPAP